MHRHLLLAGSAVALLAATPAFAQDSAAAVQPPETGDQGAGDARTGDQQPIIVTAQRREQNIIAVPASLTAYNGQFIRELGVSDFEELSRFVPGFDVQNQSPNNPGFVMRGITSDSGESFIEPRVSVYQDGVSISKARGSYVELFDMQRVEVVRGPQSTLYGRGALIGAVNLIQNKADPTGFEALMLGGYGNFDAQTFEGMVNLPLGDDAAIRLSGRRRLRDGYTENLLGGRDFSSVDTAAGRGALHVESGRVKIDIIGNYQTDDPAGTAFQSIRFRATDPNTGAVLDPRLGPGSGAAVAAGAGFPDGDLGLNRDVYGVTGILQADFGHFNLTSTTAWRQFSSIEVFDADGTSLPILTAGEDARGKQISQELRLAFDNGGPITGFIGAAYFGENGSQRTPAQFDERAVLAQLVGQLNGAQAIPGRPATDPAPNGVISNLSLISAYLQGVAAQSGIALPATGTCNGVTVAASCIAANLKSAHLETLTNYSQLDSFDLFADVTWRISPNLELGGGIRYTHDDRSTGIQASVLNGRSILGGFIGALSQPAATRTALLAALGAPGAANIPTSASYPVPLFGLGFQPTGANGTRFDQELTDEGLTYRANLRWQPTDTTSLWLNYGHGRRPEVLSAAVPAVPGGNPTFNDVTAETVDSVELGVRHVEGRRIYLEGSVYYQKYQNFQTVVQNGTAFITTNAGEAEGYGVELQARWQPITQIQLFGTYSYNHNRFKNGIFEGNRFRLSPDHSLSLGARGEVPIGNGSFDITPSVTYQSSVFFDNDDDLPALSRGLIPDTIQDEFQKGYALVNVRAGYTFDRRYRIEAFVNNLFDQSYIKDAGNTGDTLGLATYIAGEPQTYGVQLSVRF